jgi:hypothetical protein
MKNPVNSATVSGTRRSRGTMSHWPSSTRMTLPVASAAAYGTWSPTTGRSAPVRGSTTANRPSGAPSTGFHTAIRSPEAPARSCRTLIVSIPPWLWPISIGTMPSRS